MPNLGTAQLGAASREHHPCESFLSKAPGCATLRQHSCVHGALFRRVYTRIKRGELHSQSKILYLRSISSPFCFVIFGRAGHVAVRSGCKHGKSKSARLMGGIQACVNACCVFCSPDCLGYVLASATPWPCSTRSGEPGTTACQALAWFVKVLAQTQIHSDAEYKQQRSWPQCTRPGSQPEYNTDVR